MTKMNQFLTVGVPVGLVDKWVITSVDDVRALLLNQLNAYDGRTLERPQLYGYSTFRVPQEIYDKAVDLALKHRMSVKEFTGALMMEVL
jgi:hypothetical protein